MVDNLLEAMEFIDDVAKANAERAVRGGEWETIIKWASDAPVSEELLDRQPHPAQLH